jgi:hypothetical protein
MKLRSRLPASRHGRIVRICLRLRRAFLFSDFKFAIADVAPG